MRKPRSWADIERDARFQALDPDRKLELLDGWSTAARDYGVASGAPADDEGFAEINSFRDKKAQEFEALKAPPPEPSLGAVIADQFRSGNRAWEQGIEFVKTASGVSGDREASAQKIAELERANQNVAQTEDMRKFQEAEGFLESAAQIITNPLDVALPMFAQSMGSQLYPMAAGVAAGAAAGLVTTGPGAAITGLVGAGVGSGVGDAVVSFPDFIRAKGYDLSDPEQVKAAFDDPDVLAEAAKKSAARGLVVGATSAAGGLVAGRATAAAVTASAGKALGERVTKIGGAALADAAVQTGLEGAGEAGAQLVSTGKLDSKEIAAEMFVQSPMTAAEIAIGTAARIKDTAPQTAAELEKKGIASAQVAAQRAASQSEAATTEDDETTREILDDLETKAAETAAEKKPLGVTSSPEATAEEKPPATPISSTNAEAESKAAFDRYRRGEITQEELLSINQQLNTRLRRAARGEGDSVLQKYVDQTKVNSNDILDLLSEYGGIDAQTLADVQNPEAAVAWLQRNNIGVPGQPWRGRTLTPFGDQGAGTPLFDQAPKEPTAPAAVSATPSVANTVTPPAPTAPPQFSPATLSGQTDDEFNESERVVRGAIERLPDDDPRKAVAQAALVNVEAERARRTPAPAPAPAPASEAPAPRTLDQFTDEELDQESTILERQAENETDPVRIEEINTQIQAVVAERQRRSAPAPPPQPTVAGFTTAKGSTYEVTPEGKTIRTKRSEGRGQGETYEPHSVLFVPSETNYSILSDMQGGMGDYSIRIGYSQGNRFIQVTDTSQIPADVTPQIAIVNRSSGQIVPNGVYNAQRNPEAGFHPIEKLYKTDGTSSTHIGNQITEIRPVTEAAPSAPAPAAPPVAATPPPAASAPASSVSGVTNTQDTFTLSNEPLPPAPRQQQPQAPKPVVADSPDQGQLPLGSGVQGTNRDANLTEGLRESGVNVIKPSDAAANYKKSLVDEARNARRLAPLKDIDQVVQDLEGQNWVPTKYKSPVMRRQYARQLLDEARNERAAELGVGTKTVAQGSQVEAKVYDESLSSSQVPSAKTIFGRLTKEAGVAGKKSGGKQTEEIRATLRQQAREIEAETNRLVAANLGIPNPESVSFAPDFTGKNTLPQRSIAKGETTRLENIFVNDSDITARQLDRGMEITIPKDQRNSVVEGITYDRKTGKVTSAVSGQTVVSGPDQLQRVKKKRTKELSSSFSIPEESKERREKLITIVQEFDNNTQSTYRNITRQVEAANIKLPAEFGPRVKAIALQIAGEALGGGKEITASTALKQSYRKMWERLRVRPELMQMSLDMGVDPNDDTTWIDLAEATDETADTGRTEGGKKGEKVFVTDPRSNISKLLRKMSGTQAAQIIRSVNDKLEFGETLSSNERSLFEAAQKYSELRETLRSSGKLDKVTKTRAKGRAENIEELTYTDLLEISGGKARRDAATGAKYVLAEDGTLKTVIDTQPGSGEAEIEGIPGTDLPPGAFASAESRVTGEPVEVTDKELADAKDIIEEAVESFPAVNELLETDIQGYSMFIVENEPGRVYVNLKGLAQMIQGVDRDTALAYIKKILNHETRHLALLRALPVSEIRAIGEGMTQAQLREAAESYHAKSVFDTEEQREAAIKAFMENPSQAAMEYVTMLSERLQSGASIQDLGIDDLPLTVLERIVEALRAILNQLRTRMMLRQPGYEALAIGVERLEEGIRLLEEDITLGDRIEAANGGGVFAAAEGIITPQQDADYLAAVERGDMEAAQRMVDEAAKAAGYETVPLYHGTNSEFNEFQNRPTWVTDSRGFGGKDLAADFGDRVLKLYAKKGSVSSKGSAAIVNDPRNLKSADPVTRDAQGNIIPLSERFNVESNNIFYAAEGPLGVDDNGFLRPATDAQGRRAYRVTINGVKVETTAKDPQIAARNAVFKMFDRAKQVYFEGQTYTSPKALIAAITASGRRVYKNDWGRKFAKPAVRRIPDGTPILPATKSEQAELPLIFPSMANPAMRVRVGQVNSEGRPKGGFWDRLKLMVRGRFSETKKRTGGISGSGAATPLERDAMIAQQARIKGTIVKAESMVKNYRSARKKHKDFTDEQINAALGTTENPYTDAQVKELNKIKDAKAKDAKRAEFQKANAANDRLIRQQALSQLPGYNPKYDGETEFHTGLAKAVEDMRIAIDEMSRALMAGDYIPAALKPRVEQNLNVYVHRSYTIFDNPEWKRFMLEPQTDEHRRIQSGAVRLFQKYAVAEIAQELRAEAEKANAPMSQRDAIRLASRERERIATRAGNMLVDYLSIADDKSNNFFVTGELPGQRKLDIIKVRGQIPKEVRELWGEIQKADDNFVKTMSKMAGYMSATDTARELVRIGLEQKYMWKEGVSEGERPAGFHLIYRKGDASPLSVSPMDDVYAPAEVGEFMRSFRDHKTMYGWARQLAFMTAGTMAMKTIGNFPQGYVRNFFGNPFIMVNGGYINPGHPVEMFKAAKKAFKLALTSSGLRNNEAVVKSVSELTSAGLIGEGVDSGLMREMTDTGLGDLTWDKLYEAGAYETAMKRAARQATGTTRNTFEFFARIYQGVDDFWKVFAYEMEKFYQRRTHKDWTEAQISKEAIDRVRNKVPTYSLSPELTRNIRNIPFIAPFITWTSETIRTSANNLAIAAEDIRVGKETKNPEMVRNGWRAIRGFAFALGAFPTLAMLSKAMFGYDDEDEDAYREGLPEWEQNASLVFLGKAADGTGRHWNASFLDPYQSRMEGPIAFLRAMRRGDTFTDALVQGGMETLRPLLSEQLLFGAITSILRNRTAQGKPIYNEQDTAFNKTRDTMGYLALAAGPGTVVGAGRRLYLASQGTVLPTGQTYDVGNELLGMFGGQKVSSIDFRTTLNRAKNRYASSKAEATQLFSQVFSSQGTVDLEDIGPAYENAARAHRELQEEMMRAFDNAIRMGVPRKDAIQILRGGMGGAEVSKDDLRAILSGKPRRWTPSEVSLDSAKEGKIPDGRARLKALRDYIRSVKSAGNQ